jgi:hypothetical protein
MMAGKNGTIVIRDDNNYLIGHWRLNDVTPEKWAKTERADVIAFLEEKLDTKQTDPVQKDITAISELLQECLNEATNIVDARLEGKNMAPYYRAERIESVGGFIFTKLTKPPGIGDD